MSGHSPPWSVDSERALLGACVVGDSVMSSLPWLQPEMFFSPAHQAMFRAFRAIHSRGHGIDLVTVKDELKVSGTLDEVGGIEYVIQAVEAVESAGNAAYYADSVRKYWIRREIASRAENLKNCALDGDVSEAVGLATTMAQGLLPSTTYEFQVGDVVDQLDERLEPGLESTFSRVNQFSPVGGFYRGEANFIVAKRGKGKSLILCQEARNACEQGKRVAFVTLEMDAKMTVRRILHQMTSCRSRYDADRLGLVSDWDKAVEQIGFWDLVLYDTSTADDGADTVEAVYDWVLAKHEQRPIDVLLVDYVQLLGTTQRHHGDTERNVIVAKKLKKLSKRCGFVPIFAAQLQEHEGQKFIRHTKEYEDMAAYVLLMYHLKDKDSGFEGDVLECTKNRHGMFPWKTPVSLHPTCFTVDETQRREA